MIRYKYITIDGGFIMDNIRPVSDLRNHFADISRFVHTEKSPVFLTKNGYGDMVVMSIEDYRDKAFRREFDLKLIDAEIEHRNNPVTYTHDQVMEHLRGILQSTNDGHVQD